MNKKTFFLSFLFIFLIIILDQGTKMYIEQYVNKSIEIIPNFFYITKAYNTGAAWGMGQDSTLILAILSTVGTILGLWFCTKNDFKTKKMYSIALCLITSGAFGNLYDRYFSVFNIRKGVVDFLAFRFGSYNFPIFNVADMALVIGVFALAIDILFLEEKRKKNA